MASPLDEFLAGQKGALDVQRQREQLAQSQQATQAGGMQMQLQKAQLLGNAIDAVARLPQEQRFGVVQQMKPELQQFGIELPDFGPDQLTDQALAGHKAALTGFISNPKEAISRFQRGQGAIVETQGGGRAFAAEVFDPSTGTVRTELAPIGQTLTSKLGETPEQQTERKIQEEGGKVSVKGEKSRIQENINAGFDAIDPIDDIGRALELLQEVGTGKPQAVLLAAKERLGVEATNESELKSLLGRAVLAGLRASFGGNPTEGERAALADVESSFSQQGEVNRRLLNNTLNKLERKIDRAIDAAEREDDEFSLRNLLQGKDKINALRSLGLASPQKSQAPAKNVDSEIEQLRRELGL